MTLRLKANEDFERRAVLEDYILRLGQVKAAGRTLSDTYAADLLAVSKKMGQHGARIVIAAGARRLAGWIDKLLEAKNH